MGTKSKIEWTDATWNPVTGCTKVSQGCKNCYAETWANRKMGEFSKDKNRGFTDIICHEDKLNIPLKWKKPKKIFVNSMSDLFHEKVPFEFVREVFTVMASCSWYTFQILTKRPERMKEFFKYINENSEELYVKPLPNVWLGVSVEDQKTADERIPILLKVPAAVRWISAEPLLGEIDLAHTETVTALAKGFLEKHDIDIYHNALCGRTRYEKGSGKIAVRKTDIPGSSKLDWVVVGGESGTKARPVNPDWVFKIRDDCKAAGVPFFFKQWGEYKPYNHFGVWKYSRQGKYKSGRDLNVFDKIGEPEEYHNAMPEVLQKC